jgi:2-polyprenyl-3-methyl-5-hydroxy-6-metoxy-1,4-benzoquinol methylase
MCGEHEYMNYEKGGKQKEHYGESEVIARDCPLCGGKDRIHICKERGNIGVVKCEGCGLIYVNPMVRDPEKNYWGDENKYYEEARMVFSGIAAHHRDPNYLEDLKIIEKMKPEGNFLDIGTNMGFFLRHTKGRKWNVTGVDPSPALSELARKHFGLNVKTCYLQGAGFKDESFDVVTMTDVFEHIPEPKKLLADIKKVLKKDGILFIKVPNGSYNLLKLNLAKLTGRLGKHDIFDSYEHVTHYSHKTLRRMLEGSGFKVRKAFIGRPIQIPVWHKYVGHYYQYPSPWFLDPVNYIMRALFYWISRIERMLRLGSIGYFAPNIIMIAERKK